MNEVTSAVNAVPMTTATARSTTLPRSRKSLNPLIMVLEPPTSARSRGAGARRRVTVGGRVTVRVAVGRPRRPAGPRSPASTAEHAAARRRPVSRPPRAVGAASTSAPAATTSAAAASGGGGEHVDPVAGADQRGDGQVGQPDRRGDLPVGQQGGEARPDERARR